jgi:hypothetical protein
MVWLRLQDIFLEDLGAAKEGGETVEWEVSKQWMTEYRVKK